MISPIAPAILLTLAMGYLFVLSPRDTESSVSLSISDNLMRQHDNHIINVFEGSVVSLGPGLNGTQAIDLGGEAFGPYANLGGWKGYAFSDGGEIFIITYAELEGESQIFSREQLSRALIRSAREPSLVSRRVYFGPVSYDTSGNATVSGHSLIMTGASIPEGSLAVVSVYDGV